MYTRQHARIDASNVDFVDFHVSQIDELSEIINTSEVPFVGLNLNSSDIDLFMISEDI